MKRQFTRTAKICVTCLIIMFANRLNAQWVTIPAAFANYIKTYVTNTAISGSQLDTTNAIVLGTVNMTITDYTVNDITGIQYFKGLQNLVVQSSLNTFPQLPANLYSFESNSSTATAFSAALPANLGALKIYNGSINTLPVLPATLVILILNTDPNVTSVPTLPAGLLWLSISNCTGLTAYPVIPSTVYHLDLSYNSLITLPVLPATLQYLDLSKSNYGPFTSAQPTLDTFICAYCSNITGLPNIPSQLVYVDVNHCNVTTTGTMPTTMFDYNLSANPISVIPYFPDTVIDWVYLDSMPNLTTIHADSLYLGNGITMNFTPQVAATYGGGLPPIIQKAYGLNSIYGTSISANNDNISVLGQFNIYIYNLDLSYNSLTDIGYQNYIDLYHSQGCNSCSPLTANATINFSSCQLNYINSGFFSSVGYNQTLQTLNFNNNNFGYMGYVPNMASQLLMSNCGITGFDPSVTIAGSNVDLTNNSALYCIAFLNNVGYLYTSGDPANCLPDAVSYSDMNLPVCQNGNTYGCAVSSLAGGIVFSDTNQNGYRNTGEQPLPGYYVEMEPGGFFHASDSNGSYQFQCQNAVTYTITGIATLPYRHLTTSPYQEYFTAYQADTFRNIGIYLQPDVNDMQVFIADYEAPRPGFHQDYNLTAWNVGTTTENGQVVMYFNPTLSYQSSNPAGTVSGNSVSWNINNLPPGKQFNAYVDFIVPVPVPLGTPVSVGLHAFCNMPDTTPYNNNDSVTGIAYGSYDPNNKSVSPSADQAIEQLSAGNYLTYTVRFQNTGTGSAVNIVVTDTLDGGLDLSSFQFITASYKYTWSIDGRVLTVTFNGINLPDSGQSERGSHGFFVYRIKASRGSLPGSQIQNTANIYFDFNPPVSTNTATTNITTFFTTQPVSRVLCAGEPLLLTVGTNNQVRSLMWYKNGVPTGITADSIYVAQATAANNGSYYVKILASDGLYYNSHAAGVNIVTDTSSLPSFTLNPDGVLTGCQHSLSAAAFSITNLQSSSPNPIFKWYLNDSLVQSNTSWYFNWIYNYKDGDRISCYPQLGACQDRHTQHGDSAVFHVIGADTLKMTTAPVVHICKGADLTLSVLVSNPQLQVPYFTWKVNNQTQVTGDSFTITGVSANTVVIVQADTNSFACPVLCNLNGRILSRDTISVVVDSLGTPPAGQLHISYGNLFCPLTNYYDFNALGNELGTSPQYNWYQNNIFEGGTGSSNWSTNSSLVEGGVLQCRVFRNICGVHDTLLSNQLVLGPDSDLIPAVNIYVVSSGACSTPAQLVPGIQHGGLASYDWYKNGVFQYSSSYNTGTVTMNRNINNRPDTILLITNTGQPCYPVDSTTVILPPVTGVPVYLTLYGPDTVCAGSYLMFYASTSDSVIWYKNNVAVSRTTGGYYYTHGDSTDFSLSFTTIPTGCSVALTSDTLHAHFLHNTIAPNITITPAAAAFCANQIPNFTVHSNLPTANYTWSMNGSVVSYSNYYSPPPGMSYNGNLLTVQINASGQGCVPQPGIFYDTIVLNLIYETPMVTLDTNTAVLCGINHGQTFTAHTKFSGNYPDYTWYRNDTLISSGSAIFTDNNLIPGDRIYCVLTSDNPCANPVRAVSDSLILYSGSPVTPAVRITTPAPACSGANISLAATGVYTGNSPAYQWQVNGTNASTGSVFNSTSLANNDVVSCVLTSSYSCVTTSTVTSNTETITIYPAPAVPVVTMHHDTLTSTTGFHYQWYYNNTAIAGDTAQNLVIHAAGSYYVVITDANGCSSPSALVTIAGVTSVNNPAVQARLYPNPNNGNFMLVIDNDEVYDVTISDMLGREVLAPSKISRQQQFDLPNASAGVYLVSVIQNQKSLQRIKFSLVR